MLRRGDIGFIRGAELQGGFSRAKSRLKELGRVHPGAAFYAGLLAGESGDDPELEVLLYCAALESPLPGARREAALKLIPLVLSGREDGKLADIMNSGNPKTEPNIVPLRSACLYRRGLFGEAAKLSSGNSAEAGTAAAWEKALSLFSSWRASAGKDPALRREISNLLFELPQGDVFGWAYHEALSLDGLLDGAEIDALSGRLAAGNYPAALDNLRSALRSGGGIFFRHPDLISELGRAYQYTPALRDEGIELFKFWESLLGSGEPSAPPELFTEADFARAAEIPDEGGIADARYRILFYLGRMERARGNYDESSEFFTRALALAPDGIQSDACIWYTLANAMTDSPAAVLPLLRAGISQWNDISYFEDILDSLSSYFVRERQWENLLEIFLLLETRGKSAAFAKYAWILGRALEEGYIEAGRGADDFFRAALDSGSGPYYYRVLAASGLGTAFTPEWEKTPSSGEGNSFGPSASPRAKNADDGTEFILGFFQCGAGDFALEYLRPREENLPLPSLRKTAEAFAAEGRWKESLDLVSRYTRREDYSPDIEDALLAYPRPYLEPMEKFSSEMELRPETLFALVRTESYFVSGVASHAGAVGLAQLMPPTAEEMAGRIARQGGPDYREGGVDLENPELSLHIGAYYLRYLSEQMGNPMLALLAYNGGMGRLRRWLAADRQHSGGGLPYDLFLETVEYAETREYGRLVLSAAAVYGKLYYGLDIEDTASAFFR